MSFAAIVIGFLAIIVPGFFLALALLRKTRLNLFEITVIGFIFGMIFPPALAWIQGYFIYSIHAFSFSAGLYNVDVIVLTVAGILLCAWQGAFEGLLPGFGKGVKIRSDLESAKTDYRERITELRQKMAEINIDMTLVRLHEKEEEGLSARHAQEIKVLREKGAGREELEKVEEAHKNEEKRLVFQHEAEERRLASGQKIEEKGKRGYGYLIWAALLIIMLVTFASRIVNIGVAPKYFEFDPYFDMMSTSQILTWGYQLRIDHSAWPTFLNGTIITPGTNATNGTIHRIQPLMPYIEAYWYSISNTNHTSATINTTLLSNVGSVYPPIIAALLVFVVFMFIYHEYGSAPALVGAVLAAAMPTLITTFIAGEQLLEPWGIFSLFFLVAAYALAAKYPKEKRYAVLAGIAFASTFLGSHYYNVTAGVLAVYIILQGVIDTLLKRSNKDFYIMNAIVLLVIILFYAVYAPYDATLTNKVPSILGIPTIVGFPLVAFIAAFLFEYLPVYMERYKLLKRSGRNDMLVRVGLIVLILGLAVLSPLSRPIKSFFALASHYTTPSTALFMTVQEYAPTGPAFNFGSAGFGVIGASVGGFPLMVWLVLILFGVFTVYAIFIKNSRSAIFSVVVLVVLAIAGMSEVKYLPHFGVAYIIAVATIVGEVYAMVKVIGKDSERNSGTLLGIGIVAILMEMAFIFLGAGAAEGLLAIIVGLGIAVAYAYYEGKKNSAVNFRLYAAGASTVVLGLFVLAIALGPAFSTFEATGLTCTQIANNNLVVADTMFCNALTQQWLNALTWMKTNVGPFQPRILSWWDYGDWINWFGNSNAVIRGDNAVATLDYETAAHYVLGITDGYGPAKLGSFMDSVQARYVIFDDQLVPKWSALDFLACVYVSETSRAYAISAGKGYSQQFLLGTSPCETEHDPVMIATPASPTINEYCSFSNSTKAAIKSLALVGESVPSVLNVTYCVAGGFEKSSSGSIFVPTGKVYYENGTLANAELTANLYQGAIAGPGNQTYLEFLALYLPNRNGTMSAPTAFYNSTYYQGYFLGRLPGFKLVYPGNFSGINEVNSTSTVMIYELDNYTGAMPYVTPKPGWVPNNYTIPG